MNQNEIDDILAATLEDLRLSRGEKHALNELLSDAEVRPEDHLVWRSRAFALAREKLGTHEAAMVLTWLEGVVKTLKVPTERASLSEVHFSPGPSCLQAIVTRLRNARSAVDVCVFTITDDRLASALLEAHERGVRLRIITDDEKSYDRGSDVHRLAAAGIEVRADRSAHHMHHKFAIFDGSVLVTGSYNWTRSAAEHNQENILISDDERLVKPYRSMFDRFWDRVVPHGGERS